MVTRGPAVRQAFTMRDTPIMAAVIGTNQMSDGTQLRRTTRGRGNPLSREAPSSVSIAAPLVPNEPRVEAESGDHGGNDYPAKEHDAKTRLGGTECFEVQERRRQGNHYDIQHRPVTNDFYESIERSALPPCPA